jgi:hypothetical protein
MTNLRTTKNQPMLLSITLLDGLPKTIQVRNTTQLPHTMPPTTKSQPVTPLSITQPDDPP